MLITFNIGTAVEAFVNYGQDIPNQNWVQVDSVCVIMSGCIRFDLAADAVSIQAGPLETR